VTEVDILFAGVPVADIEAAASWYGQLLGRAADIVVTDDEVMWRLGDAAWLYLIMDRERAGRTLVTLCVADLDRTLREINGRGIGSGSVETIGDSGRKSVIIDPDGNSVSFIEVTARPH
jgi:predicted enzyme related to lactoylglutathione lyase